MIVGIIVDSGGMPPVMMVGSAVIAPASA